MIELRLAKDLRRSIRGGHPWIYDRALAPARGRAPGAGEVVAVSDRTGPLAIGFADPESPIRVRVLARDVATAVDADWAAARARSAATMRRADPRLAAASALRLLHGEGDLTPGLVLDLYDTTAVVIFDGDAARAFWAPRMDAVLGALRAEGHRIEHVWRRDKRAGSGELFAGTPPPERVRVEEDGARFEVDVRQGQKTGLFLDQRDNRFYLRDLVQGAEVLNLFGYTGGFSLHADRGGAKRVVTVDQAKPAIDAARRNVELSGCDARRHELVAEDAFTWLERAAAAGRTFDVVVCDPPSFAPRAQAAAPARAAYRRLNAMALRVVAPGGLLLTASCSSHVSRDDLREAVALAARDTDRDVLVRTVRGAAPDHPVLPAFPEGDYLALLDCYVA
ncbi:MAG TPA: class I SAM-dependent rRNA methyltransferase [Kofleriaceae bacterium]|nr:class I SAM-dependent rRNA methyltransferase [Kofleriaceae bacterium]